MTAAPTAPYVFLSYASVERPRAVRIADALEAAGISVWIDREAIAGGTSWGSEIVDGIEHCAALVICCTPRAMASRNVRQEIQLAWRFEKPYVPLLLEPVDFPQQVLYFLEGWQWVELLDQPAEQWLLPVLKALKRLGLLAEDAHSRGAMLAPAAAQPPNTGAPSAGAGHAIADQTATAPGRGRLPEANDLTAQAAVSRRSAPPGASIAPLHEGGAPGDAAQGSTPFVGRAKEFAALRKALDDAIAGHGRLALLAGEPGIGKTRLAEELAAVAREGGARVLWGRCWEGDGAPAYFPWLELLRARVRERDADALRAELGTGAAEIAALLPELRAALPEIPETPPATDPEQARFRLFDAVCAWLKCAAAAQPLVLVLDDLHWADKPSLLLLQYLARDLAGCRILVLGTYRDVELDRQHPLAETLAVLRRERQHERILLHGLSEPETEALLAAASGQALGAEGRRLAQALHRETEGNPFFLQETLRHLVEAGKLVQQDGRWTSAVATIAEMGIPEGVREVIGRRLSRLSPECNRALGVAAVLGREFASAALERVSGQDEDALLELLEEAERARLIAEAAGGVGRFCFTHALIRETLYEELSALRRTRLHRQAGEALEQLYARSIELHLAELSHHFGQAAAGGTVEKAIDYAERAGEAARAAFAYEDAVRHWQSAADLLEELDEEPRRRAMLLQQIGITLGGVTFGSERQRAIDALEQAVTLFERLGEERSAAHAHLDAAGAYAVFGPTWSLEQNQVHIRVAEALFERLGDQRGIEEAQAALTGVLFAGLGSAEGLALTTRSLVQLAGRQSEPPYTRVLFQRAWFLCCLGHVREGITTFERAWEAGDRYGHASVSAHGSLWHATIYHWLLDRQKATWITERECANLRLGQLGMRSVLRHWQAAFRLMQGDVAGGRAILDELPIPESYYFTPPLWQMAQGNWGAAATGLLRPEMTAGGANRWLVHIMLLLAGSCRSADGRIDEAIALFRQGLAVVTGNAIAAECAYRAELARELVGQGVLGEAREHVERAWALLAPDEDWHGLPGRVLHAEGALAAAEGRLPAAEAAFAEASALFREYEAPWEEAEVELTRARALQPAGETARAGEHFTAAEAIYRRIGAGQPWHERVQRMRAG